MKSLFQRSKGEGHGYWRCAKRGKINPCPATIIQDGGTFKEGIRAHNHAAEPGIHIAVKITSEVCLCIYCFNYKIFM